jgi:hypothetical protein
MGLGVSPLLPIMARLMELEVGRTDDTCWYLAEGAPV